MSDRNQNRLLTILGIITTVGTILVQVVSFGELKGKLETVVTAHERRLDSHDGKIDEHTKEISEIRGKLHGRVPGRVVEKISTQQ